MILLGALALLAQLPALAVQSVMLSWNPSSLAGVAGYKIYSGTGSRNYTSVIDAGNATNVTLSGLAEGSTNYFAATTYDAVTNESGYSDEVMFVAPVASSNQVTAVPISPTTTNSTPPNQPPVLHVVSNLTIVTNPADVHSLVLTWDASTDASLAGYQVFMGQASGNYSLSRNVYAVNSLVFTGLVSGTTYFFAVREFDAAWNQSGMSSEINWLVPFPGPTNSTPVTSVTPTPPPTNTPPVLNAVSGLTVTTNPADSSRVTLSWNASTDAGVAGYLVYGGQASGNYTLTQNVGQVTSLVVTGLVAGTTNFFAVQEYDAAADVSVVSPEVQWHVPLPPVLNAVSGLLATTNPADMHSVILSWNASTDAGVAGYQVFSGKAKGNYSLTRNVGLVSSLVVTGQVSGTTNYFAVREFDANLKQGGLSPEVRWFVPLAPVLHAVSNLTVTINPADIHSAIISWTPSADAWVAGYQVFCGPTTGHYLNSRTLGLVNSLVVTGLVSGVTNFYAVRERDAGTNVSGLSREARWAAPFPPNVPPTLNALGDLNLNINAGLQTVNLANITSGSPSEHQTLKVTVASSNPALISNARVSYTSPKTTGTLMFQPNNRQTGKAVLTVTVNDGGTSSNVVSRSFTVTVVDQALLAALPKITSQIKGGRVLKSKPVAFGVSVSGRAPFKYQWKFNGTNLVGQTGASLTIPAANVANAGAYMVQVSNSVGVTNSALAVLTVITNTIPTMVAPVIPQAGQFSFQVTTEAGLNYVVEATTDFQHWTPVVTNTAPFTFTEPNATSYAQRYYRTRYLP
ncbi:MAG: hypothetical protein P4N60_16070 [Verrucomicrobiae bacterium]|nr:hypothetical protein [Verrucomicrobiae bacterium]